MHIHHSHSQIPFAAHRAIVGVVLCCFLLAQARVGYLDSSKQDDNQSPATKFSRSSWIAQHMHQARFSSGVLPTTAPLPVPASFAENQISTFDVAVATTPLRINNDLLIGDSLAQPGTQAEPYSAVNPTNPQNLLAGWQENRFQNGGARTLNFGVSFDGGQTWTEGLLPNLTNVNGGAWQKASDPWVAFGPDNRAYFASLLFNETSPDNAIGLSASSDGGKTWSDPVEVFRSPLDFNDKQAMTVDTYANSPHFGTIYVAWDINLRGANNNFIAQRLVLSRSTDGGKTFSSPVAIRESPGNVGVIPRVAPDGTVYVVWLGSASESGKQVYFFSKSTDGGQTWSGKRKLGKFKLSGVPNLRVGAGLPSFDINPRTGNLYVARQERGFTGKDQASFFMSSDGGNTWTDPIRISEGGDDAYAFTVSVAANRLGEVAVSYYSLQNDPQKRFLVDQYIRLSRDGGNTFEAPIRVTPNSFDVRFAAQAGNAFFLGDYTGLAGSANAFHMVWVATLLRSALSEFQPDVFSAHSVSQ